MIAGTARVVNNGWMGARIGRSIPLSVSAEGSRDWMRALRRVGAGDFFAFPLFGGMMGGFALVRKACCVKEGFW